MLDRINGVGVGSVNSAQFVTVKKEPQAYCNPCATNPFDCLSGTVGAEALAAYNQARLNFEKNLEVEKAAPIIIDNIEDVQGERIYGSDGKLNSIVDKGEDVTTVYTVDAENPDKIVNITKTDSKTGNKIYEQVADRYDDTDVTTIYKYDSETGKNNYYARYENDEFEFARKIIQNPDGSEISVGIDNRGEHHISKNDNKTEYYANMTLDKDKHLSYLSEEKVVGNSSLYNRIEFYNGMPISLHRSEDVAVPNYMGKEILEDKDIKPAERFAFDMDLKGHEGAKTYYSNGDIESNEVETPNGLVKAYFNPDGSFSKIVTGNKEITDIDGKTQTITENLEEGTKRVTSYFDNGEFTVRYETPEKVKSIDFYEDGKPSYYYEEPVDENNRDIPRKSLSFNKMGMLTNYWN